MRNIDKFSILTKKTTSYKAIFKIMALLSFGLLYIPAFAQSPPPDLPLPPCQIIDDQEVGACIDTDSDVSGTISGEFS